MNKRRWFKSPAVLLVVFAMVVTTAGIVYAHWTSTSRVQVDINTGNMDVGWNNARTSDDGVLDDPTGTDDGTSPGWDSGNGSSADPSNEDGSTRYTKNVAACFAGGGGDTLNVNIDSAYPSYYCQLYADVIDNGSVPVRAAALRLHAQRGYNECTIHNSQEEAETGENAVPIVDHDGDQYIDLGGDGWDMGDPLLRYDNNGPFANYGGDESMFDDGDVRYYDHCVFVGSNMGIHPTGVDGEFVFGDDLKINITEGVLCGTQVDPGEMGEAVSGWIHIEQGAEQGASYRITLEQDWVNWNEYDPSMCTFNGQPIP